MSPDGTVELIAEQGDPVPADLPDVARVRDGAGYLISWTPTALLPVPEPTPAPTVPVAMMCLNLATRHDVAPLPVSQIALLLPEM